MNILFLLSICFYILLPFKFVYAKLNVITTTTTLATFTRHVAEDKSQVMSLTTTTQDPHFVEAKPSYMSKLREADLLLAVGLDLEVGWLFNIQTGSRNSKIMPGQKGFLSVGEYIKPIEVPVGKMDRSEGDVHPYGNPHFQFDPENAIKAISSIANRMAELEPNNAAFYQKNAESYNKKIKERIPVWKKRVAATGIKQVVTYHKSLNYFLNYFNLKSLATIEPKPGVPPTAKHIISLIDLVKKNKVQCILNESYFETTAAERIKTESGANFVILPVEADGDYITFIDNMILSLEKCSPKKK
jgi:zinc/manganese transport system substrate-binding protein